MKLVMTLLVKNEIDIIETNIRFHAAQGVDAFLVMDNNSHDGTFAKLQELAKEFAITLIHNDSMLYEQAKWMTQLAKQAQKELGADIVISNDADEFWATNNNTTLKNQLSIHDSTVTVNRYNYIQSVEDIDNKMAFMQCKNKVVNPIHYSKNDELSNAKALLPLQKIGPKVIVNPKGLLRIKGGNHRAKHILFWRDRHSSTIEVHHYPIRSYEQFEANIVNRKKITQIHPERKMNTHYRRWLNCLDAGTLREEFIKMHLSNEQLHVLEKVGVIDISQQSPLSLWAQKQ